MKWLQWKWSPTTTWDSHLGWLIISSKGKLQNAQFFRLVYIEFDYVMWIERNM